ncbi:hypothetical protein HDU67_003352 [Dinochytrium kinnereticum]|nr:hypothetical protein HDU67_003352 [Dinochytrium kinnereticum]
MSTERPRGPRKPGHVDLDYKGKVMLAPMVRIGTLPMRWLALKYGAGLVGTIDFVDEKDGSINLRVSPDEKDKLIVQLGSSDPENAVAAARMVMNDAAGIDLNCGCPKRFSTINCMGAALLSEPERLCSILTALVENIPLPITCKIRMLATTEETIKLVQRIEKTGVSAIALHCRQRSERPQDPGHWDIFEPVAKSISIPLIANGDLYSISDIRSLKASAPVSSFMIARAAQANFSVFDEKNSLLSVEDAIIEYLRCSLRFDMPFHNAKYIVIQMWTHASRSFGIEEEYETIIRDRANLAQKIGRTDLLSKEIQGVLGPGKHLFHLLYTPENSSSFSHCPYIPDAPYIPPPTVMDSSFMESKKSGEDDDEEVLGAREIRECVSDFIVNFWVGLELFGGRSWGDAGRGPVDLGGWVAADGASCTTAGGAGAEDRRAFLAVELDGRDRYKLRSDSIEVQKLSDDDDDDADLMEVSQFDFLKPVQEISEAIEREVQLITPNSTSPTSTRPPTTSSSVRPTRYSTRSRAPVDYKAPPLDPFEELEKLREMAESTEIVRKHAPAATRGMSMDSLFKDRQKRLRTEEALGVLKERLGSDDEEDSIPTTPRKRQTLSSSDTPSKSVRAINLIERAANADKNVDGLMMDDRVSTLMLDGLRGGREIAVRIVARRQRVEVGAFVDKRTEKRGGRTKRILDILKDPKRCDMAILSGAVRAALRSPTLGDDERLGSVCQWLFRKACLDPDEQVAEAAADALFGVIEKKDSPWTVSRDNFENVMQEVGVDRWILRFEVKEGEARVERLRGAEDEREDETEEEFGRRCRGLARGVAIYAEGVQPGLNPQNLLAATHLAAFLALLVLDRHVTPHLPYDRLSTVMVSLASSQTLLWRPIFDAILSFVGDDPVLQELVVWSPLSCVVWGAAWTPRRGWAEGRRGLAGEFVMRGGNGGGFFLEAEEGGKGEEVGEGKDKESESPSDITPIAALLYTSDITPITALLDTVKQYRVAPPNQTNFRNLSARIRTLSVAVGGTEGTREEAKCAAALGGVAKGLYTRINDSRLAFVDRTVAKHELYQLSTMMEICLPKVQRQAQAKLNFGKQTTTVAGAAKNAK